LLRGGFVEKFIEKGFVRQKPTDPLLVWKIIIMKLNLGCGNHRIDGFIGVDKLKTSAADIIHDLNIFPYPFRDNSVEAVVLFHILEHLSDTIGVINEIWRICKNEATVRIIVPYYNSPGACHDPTHVRFFTERTFDYFTKGGITFSSEYNYYSFGRFEIVSVFPSQRKIFTIVPKTVQWFLAHHLATIHSIEFILKVVKE
jgi:SAM-dependent methyltransferase